MAAILFSISHKAAAQLDTIWLEKGNWQIIKPHDEIQLEAQKLITLPTVKLDKGITFGSFAIRGALSSLLPRWHFTDNATYWTETTVLVLGQKDSLSIRMRNKVHESHTTERVRDIGGRLENQSEHTVTRLLDDSLYCLVNNNRGDSCLFWILTEPKENTVEAEYAKATVPDRPVLRRKNGSIIPIVNQSFYVARGFWSGIDLCLVFNDQTNEAYFYNSTTKTLLVVYRPEGLPHRGPSGKSAKKLHANNPASVKRHKKKKLYLAPYAAFAKSISIEEKTSLMPILGLAEPIAWFVRRTESQNENRE